MLVSRKGMRNTSLEKSRLLVHGMTSEQCVVVDTFSDFTAISRCSFSVYEIDLFILSSLSVKPLKHAVDPDISSSRYFIIR